MKAAVDTFGRVDILITAAGVNKPGPIVEQPLKEWEMIMDAMTKTAGHQTRAAQMLGISERMLRYKLKKYGIKKT